MRTNKYNDKIEPVTPENTLGIAVEQEVMDEFMTGKRDSITLTIDDDTCSEIIENFEGGLILNVENLPDTFHGCYFYNNGVFPYFIKKTLKHIALICNDRQIVGRIVGTEFTPGIRFRFGENPGEPSVEDPDGDSCIWDITFKLTPANIR